MPNTFKNYTKDGSAVAASTDMDVYTVPGSTTATVIGLTVANITTSQITVDVKLITSSGDDTFILKTAPVPAGSGIVPIGGDQKLVMETGDILRVIPDTANSADSTVSVLEIS